MAVVLGAFQVPFRRGGELSTAALAAEAVRGALADAALGPDAVEATWFGSAASYAWGAPTLGGVAALQGGDGPLPAGAPVVQVEAACATGGVALHGAWSAVRAGEVDVALVVGVDRCGVPDPVALLDGAVLQADARRFGAAEAARGGDTFDPTPGRPLLVDITALEACGGLRRGITMAQLGAVVAKNRARGAQNPGAWLRRPTTVDAVLSEPMILAPFTRSMCCALVDGAAALVVVSERFARDQRRSKGVPIAGMALSGGTLRGLGEPVSVTPAARRLFSRAGWTPDEVDVAEVHDANAFAELKWAEALGLIPPGEAGAWTEDGQTDLGGRRPVNVSGGLLSRGHALAATGVAQVVEVVTQLRGDAGERQVRGARRGLCHNGGGLIGFDDAVSVLTLLGA